MSGVVGLDLSLASTGFSDGRTASVIKGKFGGLQRLRYLRNQILTRVDLVEPDLICVEGPSYASRGGREHERGGLWWLVVEHLDSWFQVDIVAVPPASLKKYATGKGNASKDQMIVAACKRFPWFNGGNDEADALWLAALGYEHLGKPLVSLPAVNLSALSGVDWPDKAAA